MKKVLLGFGAAVVLFVGFGAILGQTENKQEEVRLEDFRQTEVVESEPEPDINQEVDKELAMQQVALEILKEANNGIGIVTFDQETKVYNLLPTNADFFIEVGAILEGLNDPAGWYGVRDSYVELSNTIRETVGSGYSLTIENPENPGTILLMVTDGEVFYDAVDDYLIENF